MSWSPFNGGETGRKASPIQSEMNDSDSGENEAPWDAHVLPSFGMFATVSLRFERSFANVYFFHIFLSASAADPPAAAAAADGHQPMVQAEPEL